MAVTDAKPVPQYGVAYQHNFAIRDNTGALVTTWAGMDSEVSKDNGNYADCTNEATEIQTSGTGYLLLTAAEMTASVVVVTVTVTNADSLPYVVTLYPERIGDIRNAELLLQTAVDGADIGGGTVITLEGGSSNDDAYNSQIFTIYHSTDHVTVLDILDWDGTDKEITVDGTVSNYASGDLVLITSIGKAGLNNFDPNVDTVDVGKISGDSTAADNLESQYDTTGLAGDTFPATQSQVTAIANVGAATNVPAIAAPNGFVITTGSNEINDEDSTQALDGVIHSVDDNGGTMDVYYLFDIGGANLPVSVTITGRLNNQTQSLGIYVNTNTQASPSWEQRDTLNGQATSANLPHTFTLFATDVMVGADAGKVALRFQNTGMVSATLSVDQILCSKSLNASTTGYSLGAIWVNTNASNENTVVDVDGTADNPVSTWAAALTLSGSLGIKRFQIANGSSIQLSDDSTNFTLLGDEWALDLNGKTIDGLFVTHSSISGIGVGSNYRFMMCKIALSSAISLGPGGMKDCAMGGAGITINAAGTYLMDKCFSAVAGTGTPFIDFEDVDEDKNLNIRHYSGGIEIKNIGQAGSTDNMSLEGHGQLVINANCDPTSNPTIALRGHFDVTDNVSGGFVAGGGILSDDVNYKESILANAIQQGYKDDTDVIVDDGATDVARGTNLVTAYTTAKALTPGGSPLSDTNRARVFLPPWHYDVAGTTIDLDTDFVDLIALYPEKGGNRTDNDVDNSDGTTDLKSHRPPRTLVYSATNDTTTVEQSTATNVRMLGFGISQLSGDATGDYHALLISADDNIGSSYDQMYYWHKAPRHDSTAWRTPIGFAKDVRGTWRDCISNSFGWRIGWDVGDASVFSATMHDCQAGAYSFIGDYPSSSLGTHMATLCSLYRCKSIGAVILGGSALYGSSFGGCSSFGAPIDSTCYFEECISGPLSYGLGATNAGTFVRCKGGDYCCGTSILVSTPGTFSGIDIGGVYGMGSLGGRKYASGTGKCTGTLRGSTVLGSEFPTLLEGATIEDSLLSVTANDQDCITLLDSNSNIHNSSLLVVEGGTGMAINAASALNVAAVGNRYNNSNAAGQTDGIGSNVTNLGTPFPPTVGEIDTELSSNHGTGTWETATGFNTTTPPTVEEIDTELSSNHGTGNWEGGDSGSGANVVTITVDDGSTALESAKVRVTKGAISLIQTTNTSGIVTFSLDDGTWTVSITLAGYTFTPTTLVVSGVTAQTYSMTEVSFPASDPSLVTGYLYTYDEDGIVESGVTVNMRFVDLAGTGFAYDQSSRTETSDATGLVSFTNLFPGARYELRRETNGIWTIVTVASTASSPFALPSFWGVDE